METKTMPADMNVIDPSGKVTANHFAELRRREVFDAIKDMADHRRDAAESGVDLFGEPTTRAFAEKCCQVVDACGRLPLGGEFVEHMPRLIRFGRLLQTGLSSPDLATDGWTPGAEFAAAVDDVQAIPAKLNSDSAVASKRVEKFEDLWRLRKDGGLSDRQIAKMTGLTEVEVWQEVQYFDWANAPHINKEDPAAPRSITLQAGYLYPIELQQREAAANRVPEWIAGSMLCELSLKLRALAGRSMAEAEMAEAD